MNPIHKALIEAIVYIDSRDVPVEIEDTDVETLESIMAYLAEMDDGQRAELIDVATGMKAREEHPARIASLNDVIEMLGA